jgi:hypothetical protein
LGSLRFRKHRAFCAVTEGLVSYMGEKAIKRRETTVKAGGRRKTIDPSAWLLQDGDRVLKPLKPPKVSDLLAVTVSDEDLVIEDLGESESDSE